MKNKQKKLVKLTFEKVNEKNIKDIKYEDIIIFNPTPSFFGCPGTVEIVTKKNDIVKSYYLEYLEEGSDDNNYYISEEGSDDNNYYISEEELKKILLRLYDEDKDSWETIRFRGALHLFVRTEYAKMFIRQYSCIYPFPYRDFNEWIEFTEDWLNNKPYVNKQMKMVDSIIGFAIGDAMGMPTEFGIREKLQDNPVTKMIGSEKTGQPAGSWTDDTSMTIATIDSYLEKGYFDYADIMDKWEIWLKGEDYTAAGMTFDVGRTCLRAIGNYKRGVDPVDAGPKDIKSNGNGSLMRMLPVALYSYAKNLKTEEIIKLTNEMSSLTHGHEISRLGCYIYVRYIMLLLYGYSKKEAYYRIQEMDYSSYSEEAISKYDRILKDDISKYDLDDISSTGYVVATLESALWLLLTTNSFNEAIIGSTNIGNDTDTIGAILGSMAGIIYGLDDANFDWKSELQRREYIFKLSKEFTKKLFE